MATVSILSFISELDQDPRFHFNNILYTERVELSVVQFLQL